MKRIFIILFIFRILFPDLCFSQTGNSVISGRVTDQEGNPLQGASVTIARNLKGVISDSNGNFIFKGLRDGIYMLRVSYLGYKTAEKEVNLKERAMLEIKLIQSSVMAGEVIVESVRAGNRSPMAYSTITSEELTKLNTAADIPFILSLTPSLVETSEAGNGTGYTSLRIRGTDASRINVTLDGVPLNDPESQAVFWVDLPDLAASVDNIQVQRGVGTSSNGAGAFGGTVSMQTRSIDYEPFARASASAGSFGTTKYSMAAGTGLLADRFAIQMRLSRLKSDGFVRRTGSDHRSLHLSGLLMAGRSRFRTNIILGEEHTGIGWWGVPLEMLETDRRYNPAGEYTDENGATRYYENETDNYRQDHYQLIYSLKLNEDMNFSSAFHYTKGKGYYEEYREDQKLGKYGLPDFRKPDTVISVTDLIRRKWMSNDFCGMVWSLKSKKERTESIIGGGLNYYNGDHFGRLIWMQHTGNLSYDYRWYLNTGTKSEASLYAKSTWSVNRKLSIYGDLQYRHILYNITGRDDDLKDLDQKHRFGFVNPKTGLFWSLTGEQDLWLSFSVAGREPTRADFKEAAGDPEATPSRERLYDTEAGYRLRKEKYYLSANGYYMYYHDQLVPTGELSNTGYTIMTNVPRSYRLGIELTAGLKPVSFLNWNLSMTLSRNKITDFTGYYTDYDTVTWEGVYKSKDLGTVDIAYSPTLTGSSDINLKLPQNIEIHLISKFVGKQYFDNTMSPDRMLDSYFVNNLRLSWEPRVRKLKSLDFLVLVNNIFNIEYESNAYGGTWSEGGKEKTWAYFFPQAGINVMFMTAINF
jgi:iron complex outermembrane receptor protein